MKKSKILILIIVLFLPALNQSHCTTKKWNGSASMYWSSDANWTPSGIPTNADDIILDNTYKSSSYTITISGNNVPCKSLTISYSGNVNTITVNLSGGSSSADCLDLSGNLIINDGGVINNYSSPSNTGNRGFEFTSSAYSWTMNGTAKYVHNQSGGSFPNASSGNITVNFATTSVFEVQNNTNWCSNTGGLSSLYRSAYGNLIINCSSTTIGSELSPNTLTINSDLTIKSGSILRMNTTGTTYGTISVLGNIIVENTGALYGTSSTGNGGIISTNGNVTTTGTGYIGGAIGGSGNSTLIIGGNLNGKYNTDATSSAVLKFSVGTGNSSLTAVSGSTFKDMIIDKNVNLNSAITIPGTLTFSDGKLTIGNYDLTIGPSGSISGATVNNYIVTNGTGQLKQTITNNSVYVSFPVGPAVGSYNPLNIKLDNTSTTDIFGVRVLNSITTPPYKPALVIQKEWNITEGTAGGSNATVQFFFGSGDFGISFDPNEILPYDIGHFKSTGSYEDFDGAISGPVNNLYTITNVSPVTGFSPYIVGNNNSVTGTQPVELASFTANIIQRNIMLKWTTANEQNNSGFEIQKQYQVSGNQYSDWEKVTFVKGNGTKNTPTDYVFEDKKLNTGKYNYRLNQIDYNGNYEYFELKSEVEITIPEKFKLSQNYPNPFNPNTKIDIDVPFDCKLILKVFDINGREIKTLINETKEAGYYTVDFNGSSMASRLYFYRIIAEGIGQKYVITKKMVLIK